MVEIGICTSDDLSSQVVETEEAELVRVHDPDVSLEDMALREVEKFKKKTKLFIGYADFLVPIYPTEAPCSIPRWTQYFLIRALKERKIPIESLADLYGNGFVGAYFAVEDECKKVYIVEENTKLVNMAMRWTGHNLDGNEGFVFSNSQKVKNGHALKAKSREINFIHQNPPSAQESFRSSMYITSEIYFPGDAGLPPWITLSQIARKKGAKAAFVYSSLCDRMVKESARDLGAIRQVLLSAEKPLVFDSLEGPKEIVTPKKALEWEKYGLIDNGKHAKPRYLHEWRVGMFEW